MAVKKSKTTRSIPRKAAKKSAGKHKKALGLKSKGQGSKSAGQKLGRSPSVTSVNKPFTKGQLVTTLAECVGIHRKEVSSLFDELSNIIAAHLKKQGPGNFTLPGLIKIMIKHKPATKARKGINPFTGEEMMFKAKPAKNVVKVRPLQKLKAMV